MYYRDINSYFSGLLNVLYIIWYKQDTKPMSVILLS